MQICTIQRTYLSHKTEVVLEITGRKDMQQENDCMRKSWRWWIAKQKAAIR